MDIRTRRLLDAFYASGYNQTELCKRTGITKGAMSSYLSGRYFPKQRALESLANELNVTIEYLMGIDSENVVSDFSELKPLQRQLLSLIEQLNDDGQRRVIEYAADLVASGRYAANVEDDSKLNLPKSV